MLKERNEVEQARRELERERASLKKTEQQTILNKGGSRAPIKFSLGGR